MAEKAYNDAHEAEVLAQAEIEQSIVEANLPETDVAPADAPDSAEYKVSFSVDYSSVSVATGTVKDGDVVDGPAADLLRDVPGVTVEATK